MKRYLLILLTITLLFSLISSEAMAIPAFARKYRMSCTTCHQPFPRLKDYGDEFAVAGFELSDQESPRYFVDTGDDELTLIRDFPIAVRVDAWAFQETAQGQGLDYKSPYIMKFLSGGALSSKLAYYFYFYFDERGEVAGIDDAFLMFDNVLGQELDIYVGQFSVSDPLMKGELRLTFELYRAYRTLVGAANARLSYDRGIMLTYDLPTGTGIVLQGINGNGIPDADGERFDNDANKNVGAYISQDIGGLLSITGSMYYGKEDDYMNNTQNSNETTMIGVLGSTGFGPLELNVQYLARTDTDPTFGYATEEDITTTGIVAEAILWPHGDASRWYVVGLYNYVDSDFPENPTWVDPANTLDFGMVNYNAVTGHFGYLLRRNVRIGLEGTYDLDTEEGRIGIGVIAAF